MYELHEEILCLVSARTPYKALAQQLSGMGIKRYTSHFSYMRSFEWDRIVKIYNCLQREKSKKILRALLTVDLTGDPNIYGYIYKNDQYFGIPEVAYIDPNEIMCEVGAYVGDVVERYIQKKIGIFNKIYAFEPAEKEYIAMKNRVERLKKEWAIDDSKIELVKAAASNIDRIGFASQHITGLKVDGNGEEKIDIVKLDSYFKEKRITFLIADIEGEEMRMLEGMEQVIIRDKPKFAIAIYHKASDIFEIPNKLLSLRDDYKFDILHHHEGCGETVLYAY